MLGGQLCLLHHREIVKVNQMMMNSKISCYIVKEYLVICQISMEAMIWMIVSQHMCNQTVKAHGFLNNAFWVGFYLLCTYMLCLILYMPSMPNIIYIVKLIFNITLFFLHMEPTIVRDDQDKEVGGVEID
ncbi:hypothetical protein IC582_010988 [Cucumis melo]